MAHRPTSAAGFLVIALVLAGCTDSKAADGPGPVPRSAPDSEFDDSTGGLRGLVVDVEQQPVALAILSLAPLELQTSSAQDGSYSFSNVPRGTYTLLAARLGYESKGIKVTIVAGSIKDQLVVLDILPLVEPRKEVLGPFSGYMQCRMATPLSSGACGFLPVVGNTSATSIWTNDKVIWNFGKFSTPDWQNIVFESRWTPGQAATNPKMMQTFSYDGRPGTHWWADSGARDSPIRFVFVRGETGPGGQLPSGTAKEHMEPTPKHLLRTWLTLPFASTTMPVSLALELRFQVMVTIFYSQDAPDTYTALPDA